MMVARPDIPHFRGRFRSRARPLRVALVADYALQRARPPRGTTLVLGNALAARLLHSLLDPQRRTLLGTHGRRAS